MKNIRRIFWSFLTVAITLLLVTGYGCIVRKMIVSAGEDKKITIKPAADFTLEIPENWVEHYQIRKSGKKNRDSYVAFYSKKCYQEGGDGWLFSIMRYKDDSYRDLPYYELVGKWNGIYYIANFPTDVQTEEVTKKAKEEYHQLVGGAADAAASIRPVHKVRKGRGVYRASDFSLRLPDYWKKNYIVKKKGGVKKNSYVSFFSKKCYEQTGEGYLFSIGRYTDKSYQELPAYEVIGMWDGIYYVVDFPTDVQSIRATKAAQRQYSRLERSVKKVVRSIQP